MSENCQGKFCAPSFYIVCRSRNRRLTSRTLPPPQKTYPTTKQSKFVSSEGWTTPNICQSPLLETSYCFLYSLTGWRDKIKLIYLSIYWSIIGRPKRRTVPQPVGRGGGQTHPSYPRPFHMRPTCEPPKGLQQQLRCNKKRSVQRESTFPCRNNILPMLRGFLKWCWLGSWRAGKYLQVHCLVTEWQHSSGWNGRRNVNSCCWKRKLKQRITFDWIMY